MAVERKDIEIYFKIEGLDAYITDLETLDSVLQQVNTATGKAKSATQELESTTEGVSDNLERSRQSVQGFKGAVDILGGSVEGLVGGLGLLGAEPAWLRNVEDGATKAIAFADGISRLADGINDVREYINNYSAATKANTTAIQAQDKATKVATITTRTFGTVLKGVGIGLVIAGIAALIANYEKLLALLGVEKKVFDTSLKDRITQLETEQRVAELRGETEVQLAVREQELARLRAINAVQYAMFLQEQGAEQDEINAAIEESISLENDYTVAIEATAKARRDEADAAKLKAEEDAKAFKEFERFNIAIINQEILDNNPFFYGSTAYFERVANELQAQVDNELLAANERKKINEELGNVLIEQLENETNKRKTALAEQLEDGLISAKTFEEAVLLLDEELAERRVRLEEETAKKIGEIDRQAFAKRLDLASQAVSAIIALNDATAGASEEEQKEAFERNKKLQIGLATIQTAQAVTAALTAGGNPVKLATGAQFVEAAIVAATGLAQILAIRKTTFDSADVPRPQAPNVVYNFQQQAGPTITPDQTSAGLQAEPIRAYVLVSDVNNAQQANQQIVNLSKL